MRRKIECIRRVIVTRGRLRVSKMTVLNPLRFSISLEPLIVIVTKGRM